MGDSGLFQNREGPARNAWNGLPNNTISNKYPFLNVSLYFATGGEIVG